MKRFAGILLIGPKNRGLFVRRSDSGLWATPAGLVEPGETPLQGAQREFREETGYLGPFFGVELLNMSRSPDPFWLFGARVPEEFEPILDHEHLEFCWRPLSQPPEPLHWGLLWLTK